MLSEIKKNQVKEVITEASIAILSSLDKDGYPDARAVFFGERDGFHTYYFSTNTSSRKVTQFENDGRSCLYMNKGFLGVTLIGDMEVCHDYENRKRMWHDGDVQYYPLGIDDPDYSVLKFTVKRAELYADMEKVSFDITEVQ